MDLVDLIKEKRFLGQEFLTWLWFMSEERGGAVRLEDSAEEVTVVFEKHLLLESGEGEDLEKVICQGLRAGLTEARTGLSLGKKIEQARILLARDTYEWHLTIRAGLFEFRSVRLPRTMSAAEEEEGPDAVAGRVLDRIFLFELMTRTVDELFRMFLRRRLAPADWEEERRRIAAWISAASQA
jgi:recombination associated protein RdgC